MQLSSLKNSTALVERLWDLWCIVSVVGIWPRFIEPKLIFESKVPIPIPHLSRELEGLKVLQLSDLHYSEEVSDHFLERILKRVRQLNPDLIVFTGDIISYSQLVQPEKLKSFLQRLIAPLGTYAIYGNHDYKEYVSLGNDGRFRKVESHLPTIMRGFSRLFSLNDSQSEGAIVRTPIEELDALKQLFTDSGVTLLHNETVQIGKKTAKINLTGLGDYMAGHLMAHDAFKGYEINYPGIVLSHNPDSYEILEHYPGDLLLFGHTHGGQVNLPYIWKKVTPIKNRMFKSGLFHIKERFLYVNRGLGATFPFRWFSPPELTLFQLTRQGPQKIPLWDKLFAREAKQDIAYGTSRSVET